MIIGIDKGHALQGAVGAIGILNEVVENRKIGDRLIQMLREKGHTVIDCSVDSCGDANTQLAGIVNKANAQHLDLFVSIHLNAGGGVGTETYTHPSGSQTAKNKARAINDAVVNSCGFRNRGVKTATFYVLRCTNAPAVLVEVCFVDSQEDANKINSEAVARGLFKAITGADFVGGSVTPSQPSGNTGGCPVLGYGTVTASVLNVRNGDSTSASVIGQLQNGARVKVGFRRGNWYNIFFGSNGGWVCADYLRME